MAIKWSHNARQVPTDVNQATEQRQKDQDRRLAVIERTTTPPKCIVKPQTGGEILSPGVYALIPGVTYTTTIESIWKIQFIADTETTAGAAANAQFGCWIGGVQAGGIAVYADNIATAVRVTTSQIWKSELLVVGTVIEIKGKSEGAGARVIAAGTKMILEQVT
jgi:hypothetical protein